MLMAADSGLSGGSGGKPNRPEQPPTYDEPSRAHRLRAAGNLANLSTLAGLLLARIGGCSRCTGPYGLVLAEGYRFSFPLASAFTVGDVVITSLTFAALQERIPRLLEHEERHSWQYFWCLGLPFLAPYTLAMGWSMLRTGDRAARNVFERHAGLADGGYPDVPVIPLAVQARRTAAWLRRRPHPHPRST